MNGVHDLGGMHNLGPVTPEANEPVFHARWEARVFALVMALRARRLWSIDEGRHARERVPGPDYLRMSYYEIWFAGLLTNLKEHELVTDAEVAAGHPAPGRARAEPKPMAADVPRLMSTPASYERPAGAPPLFAAGAEVRARNLHPQGHTRLPRYARGRRGTVLAHRGHHVFPDSNAHGHGEAPQHLYTVRFTAPELWGEAGRAGDEVCLDLWESYLEPA